MLTPKGSFGLIHVNSTYRKGKPQDQGVNVTVMDITGVTKINSMIVGLQIDIFMAWEDDRIIWTGGGPKKNQEFEFSSAVLK